MKLSFKTKIILISSIVLTSSFMVSCKNKTEINSIEKIISNNPNPLDTILGDKILNLNPLKK